MKVLTIGVEISDQYGTFKDFLVGVFDDDTKLEEAKEKAERKYQTRRTYFRVAEVEMNEFFCKKADGI